MKSEAILNWHSYRYFSYEKNLALREINELLRPDVVTRTKTGVKLSGEFKFSDLHRLVYFGEFSVGKKAGSTLQYQLEKSCSVSGYKQKQSTRYSVHGIHEYKGKFNPQVVRAILNLMGLQEGAKILDPFCGSGTTLAESAYAGMRAIGFDINPLAVTISNAKLQALVTPAPELRQLFNKSFEAFYAKKSKAASPKTERTKYLSDWFDQDILLTIERLKNCFEVYAADKSLIFLVLLSNLLRDYSQQEPADLRIRRRKSPLPKISIVDALRVKAERFFDSLEAAQAVITPDEQLGRAYLTDNKNLESSEQPWRNELPFDAAITSPPYATALPYIDTQRLSLVWLSLCEPKDIRPLEAELTGSREFKSREQIFWKESLAENRAKLPTKVYAFCRQLEKALSENDGFRRLAMPNLIYRYLSEMQLMFSRVYPLLKAGSSYALVVGHNRTTLGGKEFAIDTPDLLRQIAVDLGWEHTESISLETYHRYDLHSNNAVNAETLLILKKP